MNKRSIAIACAAVVGAFGALSAQAQTADGPWLVRARAVHLSPANDDSIPGLDVGINSKMIPEVDFTYFFTKNIAAELILTYPQKQDVRADGSNIGTLKHLPPVLSLQYHFTDLGVAKPYLGLGVNYTRFSSVNLPAGLSIDKSSWGPSLQAGVDFALDKNWSLNLDIKKVRIRTDLYSAGTDLGTIKVDPVLVGVGVGYRF